MSDDLNTLQESLGVTFNDQSHLEQALVHRSYLNENPDYSLPSNERLEFLGDAVLGFVVAEKLYFEFPHLSEGEMTKLRAALVCRETLARMAFSLGLGNYLKLGKGEEVSGGRKRLRNLACTMEALVGAILIDQGVSVSERFVLRLVDSEMERAVEEAITTDYKSRLQEVIQSREQRTPVYRTVRVEGPEHRREFTVEVMVGNSVIGRGQGRSKRMAEKDAAKAALENPSA